MLRYLNGYVLLPILEKLVKREITPKLAELRAFEKLNNEEQILRQKQEMYKLLQYCKLKVPYYQDLFQNKTFDIEKVLIDTRFIQDLPILTKELVRENSERLKSVDGGPLDVRKTGGSTGQSVLFYYDRKGLDWTSAINLYAYEMAGKKPHHTDCHISADLDIPINNKKDKLKDHIKLMSQNRKRLLVSSFADVDLEILYSTLKKMRPFLLQGHPSSLYAIASYIERHKLKPIRLCKVFEPTGEMLTAKMVETIEKNILCKVTNRYGNAEFGVIAHAKSDDHYNKLKVFQNAFYVENCESSNLIVTNLTNYGFPLLRYDTGDVATVRRESDGCFIYDIQGRIHDAVEIGEKTYPTHYIMDFLDHEVRRVREFQIVLSDQNPLPCLNIVAEDENDKDRILKAVQARWPSGLVTQFISYEELVRQGWRQKFRHMIDLRGK